jgi:hypothetical protein
MVVGRREQRHAVIKPQGFMGNRNLESLPVETITSPKM